MFNYFFSTYSYIFYKTIEEAISASNFHNFSMFSFLKKPFYFFYCEFKVHIVKGFFNLYMVKNYSFSEKSNYCLFLYHQFYIDPPSDYICGYIHFIISMNPQYSLYELYYFISSLKNII